MALNPEALLALRLDPVEQQLTPEFCILYALAIGIGRLDLDGGWRRHVAGDEVEPFPTITTVVCRDGPWGRWPGTGITPERCVHVGQAINLHAPLHARMTLVAESRIVGIDDLGAEKGAIVRQEKTLHDKATGTKLATLLWTVMARADGGFNGSRQPAVPAPTVSPDAIEATLPLPADAALLYRLTGDANPIHVDPDRARAAGFPAPLLHGLCLLGMSSAAILHENGHSAADLRSLDARFMRPTYPGETVRMRFDCGQLMPFTVDAASGPALAGQLQLA
jgi:acyl dehydratase